MFFYVTTLHRCNSKVSTPCRLTWAIGRTTAGRRTATILSLWPYPPHPSPMLRWSFDWSETGGAGKSPGVKSGLPWLGSRPASKVWTFQSPLSVIQKKISRGKCPNSNVCSCLPGSLSSSLRMAMLLQHLSNMSREQLSWWRHGGHNPKDTQPFHVRILALLLWKLWPEGSVRYK